MKRRRLLLLALVLLLVATFFWPPVYWRVVGWVNGEAFYQGRPTSWWECEIESTYELPHWDDEYPLEFGVPCWREVSPNFPDRIGHWLGLFADPMGMVPVPEMADLDALPLLLLLIQSDSSKVRRVVVRCLLYHDKASQGLVPALLKAIDDPDDEVRHDARHALRIFNIEAAAKAGVE